ncbi:MAG: hypothetical protein U9Q69_00285 [Nanoarchaeota archaeon]|nr:hypothetical protein [Nanoarchaeota archaeon]
MKKGIILIFLILAASFVLAEDATVNPDEPATVVLSDFADEPVQAIKVQEGDRMEFEMLEGFHTLYIKELVKENMKILFFPDKKEGEGSKGVGALPLTKELSLAIDVNKDGADDLKLYIVDIQDDYAVIVIKDVQELETAVPSGAGVVEDVETEEGTNFHNYLVAIGLAVFGLAIFMYSKKQKNAQNKAVNNDAEPNSEVESDSEETNEEQTSEPSSEQLPPEDEKPEEKEF